MKKFLIAVMSGVIALSLCACSVPSPSDSDGGSGGSNNSKSTTTTTAAEKSEATYGDTITFDDLEITFSDQINWVKVDNQFSDHNGADVIEIPVTIKNTSAETHGLNMFYYSLYGPDGTKLDTVSTYFDNDVYSAGDMRSGATQNTFFHVLYTGDGDYYVEFKAVVGDKVEVRLPVQK